MNKAKIISFWALPVSILIFIVPQSAFVVVFYSDPLALLLLSLSVLATLFYLLSGSIAQVLFTERVVCISGGRSLLFHGLLYIYILSYALLYVRSGSIPLVDLLLNGGDANLMRAEFTKNQEGAWRILSYVTSILSKGFLPAAITILYFTKKKTTFYQYLFVLSFISISAFEKTLLLWIYIPLIVYCWAIGAWRKSLLLVALAGLCFVVVSALALRSQGGDLASADQRMVAVSHNPPVLSERTLAVYDAKPVTPISVSLSSEVDSYQFLLYDLESGNAAQYLFNRLVWIPYVTAYDTILYWRETYPSIISFSVNRHLSALFGMEYANLEKNVFRFQFGSGEETTGNSNALYIAEAYVGFGWAGVILFSMLIGIIFGGICKANMLPFISALPIMALGLISSSLISTLFSGGLAFFFIFALLFSIPVRKHLPKTRPVVD